MKFMSYQNNKLIINANNIPADKFIRAIRYREIVRFKIMSDKEKKLNNIVGDGDIKVKSMTEPVRLITRQQLNDYKYLNQQPIKFMYLKCNREYTGFRNDSTEFGVMLVPVSVIVLLNGKRIPGGMYITAKMNNGQIDYSTLTAVRRELFHKQFSIVQQAVIENNKGKRVKPFGTELMIRKRQLKAHSEQQMAQSQQVQQGQQTAMPNITQSRQLTPAQKQAILRQRAMLKQKQAQQQAQQQSQQPKYKFIAVGIINRRDGAKLVRVGFMLQDRSGKTYQVREDMMPQIISQVKNLEYAQMANGTNYIRGNGCRLEDLKTYLQ